MQRPYAMQVTAATAAAHKSPVAAATATAAADELPRSLLTKLLPLQLRLPRRSPQCGFGLGLCRATGRRINDELALRLEVFCVHNDRRVNLEGRHTRVIGDLECLH